MMIINSQAIRHKTFGNGIVTDLTANTITVCFPDGEKKFIYPDAFKNHLILRNKKMQQSILTQIAKKETEIELQRQTQRTDQKRRHKLLHFTITANSHAALDILPKQVEHIYKTCKVSTGQYKSGYSKGQPRIAKRLKPNSVCLLTERPNKQSEQERRIVGAFMVKEDYFGENAQDEFIEGHSKYQILVPPENILLFWNHFDRNVTPHWGYTPFRYCSGEVINHILFKMTQILLNTEQQEQALAFYEYFCKMNQLASLIKITAYPEKDV